MRAFMVVVQSRFRAVPGSLSGDLPLDCEGALPADRISRVVDEATGQSFFRVRVSGPSEELARLGEIELVPGMSAEAYLQNGERAVLSYLIRPVTDHVMAAFREE